MNASQIPPNIDGDGWSTAKIENAFREKPIIRKRNSKRSVSTTF